MRDPIALFIWELIALMNNTFPTYWHISLCHVLKMFQLVSPSASKWPGSSPAHSSGVSWLRVWFARLCRCPQLLSVVFLEVQTYLSLFVQCLFSHTSRSLCSFSSGAQGVPRKRAAGSARSSCGPVQTLLPSTARPSHRAFCVASHLAMQNVEKS